MEKSKNRLVVGDATWADIIPDWLLEEIKAERLIYGLAGIANPEVPKVGDAVRLSIRDEGRVIKKFLEIDYPRSKLRGITSISLH